MSDQRRTRRVDPLSSELGEILLDLTGRVVPEQVRGLNASVVLESPDETWTMWFARGRMTVGAGAAEKPDTVVRADTSTLVAIHSGATTGVAAFLDGLVTVRGNLNLALRAESFFDPILSRPATAPSDSTVKVGQYRVNLLDAGRGDPVILLHGLGATKASFLPTMAALAPHHRVIAPDLLGHGDTSKPHVSYTPKTYARFAVGLLDALGIDRAHFVGNSLGGRISLEVALSHPDRVKSISLLCPAVAFLKRRGFVPLVRWLRPEFAMVPHRLPHRAVVAGIRSLFVTPDVLPRPWYDAAADEFLRVFRSPAARFALFDTMRNLYLDEPSGSSGFWTRLEKLDVPAMFLWGDRDPLVPPAFAPHVRRLVPDARSEILERCGHVPQFELGELTHRKIRRLIATTAA